MKSLIKNIFHHYFELCVWIAALVYLAAINPEASSHFSICAFKWMGFSYCPGCGLGHSISFLLHGQIQQSLYTHPLGIFALGILLHRIFKLLKSRFRTFQFLK